MQNTRYGDTQFKINQTSRMRIACEDFYTD